MKERRAAGCSFLLTVHMDGSCKTVAICCPQEQIATLLQEVESLPGPIHVAQESMDDTLPFHEWRRVCGVEMKPAITVHLVAPV